MLRFLLLLSGLLMNLFSFLLVAFRFCLVLLKELLGRIIFRTEDRDQILAQFQVVKLDALRLLILPLIIGFGFKHDTLGMGPVGRNGD